VNPIDNYKSFKTQQSEARRQNEHQAWERWKNAPDHEKPEALKPLLQAYAPTFNTKKQLWRPPRVPESVFESHLHKHFVKALETFDPSKASLSTHVEMRLQKVMRDTNKTQNIGYIPEGQTALIGRIQKAHDELHEEHGRAPTDDELADHLGMPLKKVKTVRSSMKRDLPSSLWESDPLARMSSREQEVLPLLPSVLSADEKQVFDHIYGLNGKHKVSDTGALASLLGKNQSQISRLKSGILAKFNQFK
jgi:hypothetical protein